MTSSFAIIVTLLAVFWAATTAGLSWAARKKPPVVAAAGHLSQIDGLRGVLALSVFIHHASCFRHLYLHGSWYATAAFTQVGIYAVTLFFFITGFLFWSKLQRDPHPDLGRHFSSRIKRLGPAYWASLGLILLIVAVRSHGKIVGSPLTLLQGIGSWIAFALPGQIDLNGMHDTGRMDAGITWTLQLEWIFYALIPFCGWFAARSWRVGLFLALTVVLRCLALQLSPALETWPVLQTLITWMTWFLMMVFAGGIVTATVRPWIKRRYSQVNFQSWPFSATAVGLVIATLLWGPPDHFSPPWETLWLIIPFLLIALGNDWFGFLTSAPTLFLGKISYSIYLLHGIILYVVFTILDHVHPIARISGPMYWVIIAVLGVGVIGSATVWHRLFEAPFMKAPKVESARAA